MQNPLTTTANKTNTMTPELTIKLARVRAILNKHIEEANSVPKGLSVSYIDQGDGRQIQAAATSNAPPIDFIRVSKPCVASKGFGKARSITNKERDATAAFITSARTLSPLQAKALLMALDYIEEDLTCYGEDCPCNQHKPAENKLAEIANLFADYPQTA